MGERVEWIERETCLRRSAYFDVDHLSDSDQNTLKFVGAIDISYSKKDEQKAVAALMVFEYPSMKIVYEDFEKETANYPYIPGFLAFKEVPVYSILFTRLKEN